MCAPFNNRDCGSVQPVVAVNHSWRISCWTHLTLLVCCAGCGAPGHCEHWCNRQQLAVHGRQARGGCSQEQQLRAPRGPERRQLPDRPQLLARARTPGRRIPDLLRLSWPLLMLLGTLLCSIIAVSMCLLMSAWCKHLCHSAGNGGKSLSGWPMRAESGTTYAWLAEMLMWRFPRLLGPRQHIKKFFGAPSWRCVNC